MKSLWIRYKSLLVVQVDHNVTVIAQITVNMSGTDQHGNLQMVWKNLQHVTDVG